MSLIAVTAIGAGAAWAAGLNTYAVICALGLLGSTGHLELPPDLMVLTNPLVIAAAGFMYCVEFFADKIPGVDSIWDVLHTFVRIPAGAILAAASFGQMDPALQIAAFLVGGGLAASSHATKAAGRVVINASPEPISNWTASITEDVIAISSVYLALNHPVLLLVVVTSAVTLTVVLLPKLWHAIQRLRQKFISLFDRKTNERTNRPVSAPENL
jgi:Domain of unknown function (DUF4126)